MKKKMSKVIAKVISTVLAVTLVIGLSPAILAETAYHTETPATGSQTDNESSETATPEEDTTNEESTTQGIVPFTDAGPLIRNNTTAKGRSAKTLVQEEEEGLILDKTAAKAEGDDRYSINMEAFVTGKLKTEPTDIVLVLDQSSSMSETMIKGQSGHPAIDEKVEYNRIYLDNVQVGKEYYVERDAKYYSVIPYYEGNRNSKYFDCDELKISRGIPKSYSSDSTKKSYQLYTKTITPAVPAVPEIIEKTRLAILKESVQNFVENVAKSTVNENDPSKYIDHRIAMVGFAYGDKNENDNDLNSKLKYKNTELFIGANQYTYKKEGTDSQYVNAFQDVGTKSGVDTLNESIKKLDAEGATRIDLGFEMANNVFTKDSYTSPVMPEENRNKVIIVFTDGIPTAYDKYSSDVANRAILEAEEAKARDDTTVYTIGVVDGADPTQKIVTTPNTDPNRINKFLHFVSSNYNLHTLGIKSNYMNCTIPDGGLEHKDGYYLTASNANDLNTIFAQIFQQIDSGLELGIDTVLKDVISEYFKMDENTVVTVSTMDYIGKDSKGIRKWNNKTDITNKVLVDRTTVENTITVTGFDYSAHRLYDSIDTNTPPTPAKGQKLIVEVHTFTRADGFIGGNQVPTNTPDSGIVNNKININEKFPEPEVDVSLKYEFKTNPQSIYVGSQWNDVQKFFLDDSNELIYEIDNKKYNISGINNKFVNIEYEVIDSQNDVVGKYVVNAGSKQGVWNEVTTINSEGFINTENFTINAVITPIEKSEHGLGSIEIKELSQEASLYIYKPTLVATDEYVFLGDTTNVLDRLSKPGDVTWICDDTSVENIPQPEMPQPNLNIVFTDKTGDPIDSNILELYKPIDQSDFKVHVENGTKNITESTTITNEDGKNDKHDFTIHVVKGQLEITKSINQQYTTAKAKNANQTFLFKVERRLEKDGVVVETFYQTLDFSANEENTIKSVNIKGLQKGYYTVSEVNDWSWKYNEIAGRRKDNYKGNGIAYGVSENSMIFIGDKDKNNTTGFTFYGTEVGTVINGKNEALPAQTAFVNELSDKKILSDTASAVNTFQSFDKMISGLNKFKKYR